MSSKEENRLDIWAERWEQGETGFHMKDLHVKLLKHMDKLNPDGKLEKIFIPLCGKTVDIKWLSDQGLEVVGVEGVQQAVDEFFTENKLERTESTVPQLGPCGKLLKSQDGKIKLYCGDMFKYSKELEDTFPAMWDRGALVALDREDVPNYAQILKDLLSPGGRLLVEVMEYDLVALQSLDPSMRPPPPFAMTREEMKKLFEPECTVEQIDTGIMKYISVEFDLKYYLIVKK